MYLPNWEANDKAQQEHNARMEASERHEDAMPVDTVWDFDQSLSLADVFILHALGVKLALYPEW